MGKIIHYFSFYLSKDMEEIRESYPAAFPKVEYVKEAIIKSGFEINLVSTAVSKKGWLGKEIIDLSDNERHIYLPTIKFPKFTMFFMWLQIVWYVVFNVKKNDKVLVYHSLLYIKPFIFLRKFKKFKLILEFNDLYHVVSKKHANKKIEEIEFIRNADSYLFMNRIAEKEFNEGKPYVISYGNYLQPARKMEKFSDGKIHVVYAGIIEDGRKAARLTVESALYLDCKYIIHILGFGSNDQINLIKSTLERINKEKGYEAVVFHGRLRGEEFSDFLHSCHIGVSSHAYLPEEMDSASYTFPSKIPTYISHDLYVVSPDIPCVAQSPFAKYTTFYHEHTPEDLANAISSVSFKNNEAPTEFIKKMDDEFNENLRKILLL